MRSKKIRKVILISPALRRIRNNLRIIIKLAVKEELHKLSNLKGFYFRKAKLTPSQQRRKAYLKRRWNRLYHNFVKSTLQCNCGAACTSYQEAKSSGFNPQDRPTDLDLVWVPWLEGWVCTNCFEASRYGEMTHKDFDDTVTREWAKEEFGI